MMELLFASNNPRNFPATSCPATLTTTTLVLSFARFVDGGSNESEVGRMPVRITTTFSIAMNLTLPYE